MAKANLPANVTATGTEYQKPASPQLAPRAAQETHGVRDLDHVQRRPKPPKKKEVDPETAKHNLVVKRSRIALIRFFQHTFLLRLDEPLYTEAQVRHAAEEDISMMFAMLFRILRTHSPEDIRHTAREAIGYASTHPKDKDAEDITDDINRFLFLRDESSEIAGKMILTDEEWSSMQ